MMKKFLFFMLAAALFCGCNKDDAPCPVAEVDMPASSAENPVQPGSPVTIQGKGFTSASEIWLRGMARTDTQATVSDVTATAITFIAPAVSGEQAVILKQDGSEWNLGKMYFVETSEIAILPKKLVKIVDVDGGSLEYTYDNDGRLSKINRDGGDEVSEIEYTANKITVTDDYGQMTIQLDNGRATKCVEKYTDDNLEETNYSYGSNGYLSGFVYTSTGPEEDAYKGTLTIGEDGHLKTYQVKVEKGEYGPYTIDFTPNKNVRNNLNLDFMWDYDFMIIDELAVGYAYLLGIGGKRMAYLPQQIKVKDEEGSFTIKYDYKFDGDYLSEIHIDDSDNESQTTLKLYYEE
ncbi:MAG: hypothetical protein NC250_01400 [Alistipes senegalensis]|nr:hypothetical protein [Bacteroides cellulosilyticus]MCM1351373.1 hypothetical protein [Alistipes senegalensis]